MKLGYKIKMAREMQEMSQWDLSSKSGVSRASIQLYEADKGNVTISNLEKIADALKIDINYFFDDMPAKSQSSEDKKRQKLVKYYPNIKLSAGDGVINYEDGEYQLIDASFLGFLKLKGLQNIEVVQVQGDSMMPYIEDGEYVVLERRADARNGDIVVFVYENQSYIKQLQTIPNEAKLCFISKNPLYPSFEVRGDEVAKVAIIGVLRAKIRKF